MSDLPKLKLTYSVDSSDCETCGGNYDEALLIEMEDGTQFGELAAASCFGRSQDYETVFLEFLKHHYDVEIEHLDLSEDHL